MSDNINSVLKELRQLEKRATILLGTSILTPCQITGEPGILIEDGARCINMCLSPDMIKEFEKRARATCEFGAFQKADMACKLFKHDNVGYNGLGDLPFQEAWLHLCADAETAETTYGLKVVSILREMTDEFGAS